MHRFALDQNFPTPAVEALRDLLIEAELVSIRDIDDRLSRMDDWELLLALHHRKPRIDGLITADSSMTSLPREMCVLAQTRLTLVVAAAVGHDPLKATGLVLAHLPNICKQSKPNLAQVWTLRATSRPHETPEHYLTAIAKRERRAIEKLRSEHRLSPAELGRDPLTNGAS